MIVENKEPVSNLSNSANLKEQLNYVLKEISLFSQRINDMKCSLKEEDKGFATAFDYEARLGGLRQRYNPGKEPAKPVIFLTEMVIEALLDGPRSEKDIKLAVLDRCRELGVKSSNRGLIAGSGMDVGTVCNVLSALGAIEAATTPSTILESTSDRNTPKSVAASKLASLTTIENTLNNVIVKSEAIETTVAAHASDKHSKDTSMSNIGPELHKSLSKRWSHALNEYLIESKKNLTKSLAALTDTPTEETSANNATNTMTNFALSNISSSCCHPTAYNGEHQLTKDEIQSLGYNIGFSDVCSSSDNRSLSSSLFNNNAVINACKTYNASATIFSTSLPIVSQNDNNSIGSNVVSLPLPPPPSSSSSILLPLQQLSSPKLLLSHDYGKYSCSVLDNGSSNNNHCDDHGCSSVDDGSPITNFLNCNTSSSSFVTTMKTTTTTIYDDDGDVNRNKLLGNMDKNIIIPSPPPLSSDFSASVSNATTSSLSTINKPFSSNLAAAATSLQQDLFDKDLLVMNKEENFGEEDNNVNDDDDDIYDESDAIQQHSDYCNDQSHNESSESTNSSSTEQLDQLDGEKANESSSHYHHHYNNDNNNDENNESLLLDSFPTDMLLDDDKEDENEAMQDDDDDDDDEQDEDGNCSDADAKRSDQQTAAEDAVLMTMMMEDDGTSLPIVEEVLVSNVPSLQGNITFDYICNDSNTQLANAGVEINCNSNISSNIGINSESKISFNRGGSNGMTNNCNSIDDNILNVNKTSSAEINNKQSNGNISDRKIDNINNNNNNSTSNSSNKDSSNSNESSNSSSNSNSNATTASSNSNSNATTASSNSNSNATTARSRNRRGPSALRIWKLKTVMSSKLSSPSHLIAIKQEHNPLINNCRSDGTQQNLICNNNNIAIMEPSSQSYDNHVHKTNSNSDHIISASSSNDRNNSNSNSDTCGHPNMDSLFIPSVSTGIDTATITISITTAAGIPPATIVPVVQSPVPSSPSSNRLKGRHNRHSPVASSSSLTPVSAASSSHKGHHHFHLQPSNKLSSSSSSAAFSSSTLFTQPASALHRCAKARYRLCAAQEKEELLLRRIAGQCGISLNPARYRTGTTYLDDNTLTYTKTANAIAEASSRLNLSRQNINSSNWITSSSKAAEKNEVGIVRFAEATSSLDYDVNASASEISHNAGAHDIVTNDSSVTSTSAVYDEPIEVTADFLIDKVNRLRRQRGDCLYTSTSSLSTSTSSSTASSSSSSSSSAVGIFNPAYLHSLAAVCNNTTEVYWNNLQHKNSDNMSNNSSNIPNYCHNVAKFVAAANCTAAATTNGNKNSRKSLSNTATNNSSGSMNYSNNYYANNVPTSDPISMVELVRNMNSSSNSNYNSCNIATGVSGGSLSANTISSMTNSNNNIPNVLCSGNNSVNMSLQVLRRYAQPLTLPGSDLPMLDAIQSATTFAANTPITSSSSSSLTTASTVPPLLSSSSSASYFPSLFSVEVLRIPDLTLNTRELAWTTIASEFAVVAAADDPATTSLTTAATLPISISMIPLTAAAANTTTIGSTGTISSGSSNSGSNYSDGNTVSSKLHGNTLKKRKYSTGSAIELNGGISSSSNNSNILRRNSLSDMVSLNLSRNTTATYSGGNEDNIKNKQHQASSYYSEVLAPQFKLIAPISLGSGGASYSITQSLNNDSSSSNNIIDNMSSIGPNQDLTIPTSVLAVNVNDKSIMVKDNNKQLLGNENYEEEEEEEDLSDEAVLARHEKVLKAMRDRWNKLQQLKLEASRIASAGGGGGVDISSRNNSINNTSGSSSSDGYARGAGYGGYCGENNITTNNNKMENGNHIHGNMSSAVNQKYVAANVGELDKFNQSTLQTTENIQLNDTNDSFNNVARKNNSCSVLNIISPRKRGLSTSHIKRRGRPPKHVKSTHSVFINPCLSSPTSLQPQLESPTTVALDSEITTNDINRTDTKLPSIDLTVAASPTPLHDEQLFSTTSMPDIPVLLPSSSSSHNDKDDGAVITASRETASLLIITAQSSSSSSHHKQLQEQSFQTMTTTASSPPLIS